MDTLEIVAWGFGIRGVGPVGSLGVLFVLVLLLAFLGPKRQRKESRARQSEASKYAAIRGAMVVNNEPDTRSQAKKGALGKIVGIGALLVAAVYGVAHFTDAISSISDFATEHWPVASEPVRVKIREARIVESRIDGSFGDYRPDKSLQARIEVVLEKTGSSGARLMAFRPRPRFVGD